jgi:uncharacterized membrane protein YciS (DUF1049 family)
MRLLRYLKKFIGSLILLVLVVAAVTFAVSNRAVITVSLWPLDMEPSVQLGAAVLAAFALGLIAGTAVMAASRFKLRYQARSSQRRVASLEKISREASTTLPAPVAAAPEPDPRRG